MEVEMLREENGVTVLQEKGGGETGCGGCCCWVVGLFRGSSKATVTVTHRILFPAQKLLQARAGSNASCLNDKGCHLSLLQPRGSISQDSVLGCRFQGNRS